MPIKKKTPKAPKPMPAPPVAADVQTPTPAEPQMTVVTEVVDVIEEKVIPSQASSPAPGPSPNAPPSPPGETGQDEVSSHPASAAEANPAVTEATAQEKRKEMVEELFKKEQPQVMPEISMHRNGNSKAIVVWGIIVVACALAIGGGLVLVSRGSASVSRLIARPAPSPTPPPSPTPQAVNRQAITIQVLNGGGVSGAAGKMKTALEEKGYTVTDVGNTDEYTYQQTEILVKPSQAAYLKLLQEDLGEKYTIGTAAATLSGDVSYDARVIVGKE